MKLATMIAVLMLMVGCSQGPDFSNESVVESKYTEYGKTTYKLHRSNKGVRGQGWGSVKFMAPEGFADTGDTVVFKDGKLYAIKPK